MTIKKFKDLIFGDRVYFINPTTLRIDEIVVNKVERIPQSNHVKIEYFTATEKWIELMHKKADKDNPFKDQLDAGNFDLPTAMFILPAESYKSILPVLPPTIYCTDKKVLRKWMIETQ